MSHLGEFASRLWLISSLVNDLPPANFANKSSIRGIGYLSSIDTRFKVCLKLPQICTFPCLALKLPLWAMPIQNTRLAPKSEAFYSVRSFGEWCHYIQSKIPSSTNRLSSYSFLFVIVWNSASLHVPRSGIRLNHDLSFVPFHLSQTFI